MAVIRESVFMQQVHRYIKQKGFSWERFAGTHRSDRMVTLPKGRVLFIEFKRHSKSNYKLTSGQRIYIDKRERLGHITLILTSDIDWKAILDDTLKELQNAKNKRADD